MKKIRIRLAMTTMYASAWLFLVMCHINCRVSILGQRLACILGGKYTVEAAEKFAGK